MWPHTLSLLTLSQQETHFSKAIPFCYFSLELFGFFVGGLLFEFIAFIK